MKLSEEIRKVSARVEGQQFGPPPPEQVDDWAGQAEALEQEAERLRKGVVAQYRQGFCDGVTVFAVWKDGHQEVGVIRRPLSAVLAEVEKLSGYRPPKPALRGEEEPT